jgi:hypothetical protein
MSTSAGRILAQVKATASTGRWSTMVLETWGLSLSALVGADGSIVWRFVRIGVVLTTTAAAL